MIEVDYRWNHFWYMSVAAPRLLQGGGRGISDRRICPKFRSDFRICPKFRSDFRILRHVADADFRKNNERIFGFSANHSRIFGFVSKSSRIFGFWQIDFLFFRKILFLRPPKRIRICRKKWSDFRIWQKNPSDFRIGYPARPPPSSVLTAKQFLGLKLGFRKKYTTIGFQTQNWLISAYMHIFMNFGQFPFFTCLAAHVTCWMVPYVSQVISVTDFESPPPPIPTLSGIF